MKGMLSLYVHIPFCRDRCPYCDFFLVTRTDHIDRFFEALAEETLAKAEILGKQEIKAVHFGGGTPSMVPPDRLGRWIGMVAGLSCLSPDTEITLEANPEDLEPVRLDGFREAGVNRISIGCQSFGERKLAVLGRRHTRDDVFRAVQDSMIRFDSVSVDLMCGVEGETSAEWENDLRCVIGCGLPHVSVYMLTLEEKTVLSKNVRNGLVVLPGDDLLAELYEQAASVLAGRGYRHYEVSNYALSGHHSRYNLACWMREPYLGFGPSAHSFLVDGEDETRFSNVRSLIRYLEHPAGAVDSVEVLTPSQRFNEEVFLSLRINRGLSVEFLRKAHKLGHQRLTAALRDFQDNGWISIEDNVLTLTGKGFLFADLIAEALILE
jgi:oxygen-independent coproporphyrinogen-3 oxidase